ncbi:MAG: hypothetical protein PF574_05320 [Candidatus Delongbacteria bacterium]|nr:hypothetical protein [Candidatus Delongbacteria bacterium]
MKKLITMILITVTLFVGQLNAEGNQNQNQNHNGWIWVGAGWVYTGNAEDPIDPPTRPPL